jgi:hypothetical protein
VRRAAQKQRLRERSEYVLRLAAMKDQRARYPAATTESALPREGLFWRYVFVPLYRRVSWSFKRRAMHALRMTAAGWSENPRRFREPWRPPSAPAKARSDGSRPSDRSREPLQR